jgi:hypothetical protein
MVFITHFLKSAALKAAARCIAGWFALLLLAVGPGSAAAAEITQLRTERAEEGLYLSAVVRFDLPAVVEDALRKGIPAFFVVESTLYRDRWYWTNQRVGSVVRTVRLSYQPLTGRWRVNIVPGLVSGSSGLRATLNQNYESLPEALSALQRISRWKIAEAAELDPEGAYTLDLNFWLDLTQLPRPFQIGVAGLRDWTISAQATERLKLAPAASSSPGASSGEGGK